MQINKGYIIIICLFVVGCATVRTPHGYVPRTNEIEQNVYGSWIAVIHVTDGETGQVQNAHGGELLAIQDSTLYLIYLDSLKQFPIKDIPSATLVTHKFGGPQYFGWAGLFFIPNLFGIVAYSEYAGGFATLGLIHLLSASIATAINYASVNEIKYPDHILDLEYLKIYSRFPQGIPPGIDPYQLTSKPLLE